MVWKNVQDTKALICHGLEIQMIPIQLDFVLLQNENTH